MSRPCTSAGTPGDSVDVDPDSAQTVSGTLTVTDGQWTPNTGDIYNIVSVGTNGIMKPDASASISISGNFTNSGTFTHNSGTVVLNGAGGSTQVVSGNTTFNNLTATTSTARTIEFAGSSTQTISGTWTVTGASAQLITLARKTGDSGVWTINPTAANVSYVNVSNSTNTGVSFCATYSTNGGGNTGWSITGGASCNTAPNSPSSLVQKKVTGGATLNVGDWTNETQVKFEASATDPDNPDTLQLCVEAKDINTAFNGSGETCGTGVAYSGSAVTVSITISSQTDATQYHWRARIKDAGTLYSGYVAYGANPAGDGTTDGSPANRDYGIDTTAPTGGTVKDGTGSDQDWNDGSLTALDGNWTGTAPNSDVSGLQKYEYAIRRQSDGYYWSVCSGAGAWQVGANWCDNGTGTALTRSSLNLQTGVTYYVSLRTTDNAGNTSTPIDSNGQQVLPTLSFTLLGNNPLVFENLNNGNTYTRDLNSWPNLIRTQTSTNAVNGYSVYLYGGLLTSIPYPSQTISAFNATWANPDPWGSTCIGGGSEFCGFGYTSSDTLVDGVNRFAGGTEYAPINSLAPGDIVADNAGPVNGSTGSVVDEIFNILFRVSVPSSQSASKYEATMTVIISARY